MQQIVAAPVISLQLSKIISFFDQAAGSAAVGESQTKVVWLARLRWAFICAQLGGLFPFLYYGLIARQDVATYLWIIGLLASFNVLVSETKVGAFLPLLVQMIVDLVALGVTLTLTQGCANPLSALIYMHAALGPLLLAGKRSLVYLAAICLSLALYCLQSQPAFHGMHGRPLPHTVSLVAQILAVLAIWGITTWLSSTLVRLRFDLEKARQYRQRSDHLKALGAMAASFTHEFATPLNTVKMRLERLERSALKAGSQESDLAAAMAAINQCESVMRGLFGSELQAGTVHLEHVELSEFVRSLCDTWLKHSPVDVNLDFQSSEQCASLVSCVPRMALARSLIDLLDNARESATHATPDIDVTLAVDGGRAVIEVADRGCGMPNFVRERVGEPFVSTHVMGTGLGLYTANALMEALGGALLVRDRERGGTVVTMTFPSEQRV